MAEIVRGLSEQINKTQSLPLGGGGLPACDFFFFNPYPSICSLILEREEREEREREKEKEKERCERENICCLLYVP